MKLCPNCNSQNADAYTQCVNCGAVLPQAAPQPVYSGNTGYGMPMSSPPTEVTSPIGWFGWYLLCSYLPIIGPIIMMNVSKDPSAKSFAKLTLVLSAIGLVLLIIVIAFVFSMIGRFALA